MTELDKPFPKNLIKKTLKNLKINVKKTHVSKKQVARKSNLVQTKNRPRMNYEWIEKNIKKKSNPKNWKNK